MNRHERRPRERRVLVCILTAAGALALSAAPILAATSAGAAPAAPPAAAPSRAAVAARDAAAVLGLIDLPPGAVSVSGPPAGTGSALAQPPSAPDTPNLVTRLAYWTVPDPPAAVLAFVDGHPPAGSRPSGSGSGIGVGGIHSVFTQFSFPATAVLDSRMLSATLVATSATTTAVLVAAQDVWITARPASERVPAQARFATVEITLPDDMTGEQPRPARRIHVTSPAKVARLVAAVNALPAAQPGVESCPAGSNVMVSIAFRATPSGPVLALVRADPTGCGGVSLALDGHPAPPLSGGGTLTDSVERILGIHVALGV